MQAWQRTCKSIWPAARQTFRQTSWLRLLSTRTVRIADLLQSTPSDDTTLTKDVTVHGFVRSVRRQKRIAFAAIGDGSTLRSLQIVLDPITADKLSSGAAVAVTGKWIASPAGKKQENELQVSAVQVLGENYAPSNPIQKKYQTSEYLRSLPHLRPRIPVNALLLHLRSKVIADITQFFSQRGFVQTHPPIITSSDCEGAGEVFEVNRTMPVSPNMHNHDNLPLVPEPFFKTPKYLTVSSQLHLEALAQAVGKVWTLSPTFRAEESDTPRHLAEFYMLEAEVAFVDRVADVMDVVEDMIRYVVSNLHVSEIGHQLLNAKDYVYETQEGERALLSVKELSKRWEGLLRGPWPRITYHEACTILQNAVKEGQVTFEQSVGPDTGLQTEHERYIAEVVGESGPVFVTDYPKAVKPFYMAPSAPDARYPGDVPTVACFDLLVPDVCEIVGGSMREHRRSELQEAMRRNGLVKGDMEDRGGLDWYVDLRRYGSVPHGGFGLGFDRLLGYLAGVSNVRDVVAFPRHYGRCLC